MLMFCYLSSVMNLGWGLLKKYQMPCDWPVSTSLNSGTEPSHSLSEPLKEAKRRDLLQVYTHLTSLSLHQRSGEMTKTWNERHTVSQLNLPEREVCSAPPSPLLILRGQHFCCLISPHCCGHVHIIKLLKPLTGRRPPPTPSTPTILPPSSPEIIKVLQIKSQSHKSGNIPTTTTTSTHIQCAPSLLPSYLSLPSCHHLTWTNSGSAWRGKRR